MDTPPPPRPFHQYHSRVFQQGTLIAPDVHSFERAFSRRRVTQMPRVTALPFNVTCRRVTHSVVSIIADVAESIAETESISINRIEI